MAASLIRNAGSDAIVLTGALGGKIIDAGKSLVINLSASTVQRIIGADSTSGRNLQVHALPSTFTGPFDVQMGAIDVLVYLNADTGDDTLGDGTQGNPLRTPAAAMSLRGILVSDAPGVRKDRLIFAQNTTNAYIVDNTGGVATYFRPQAPVSPGAERHIWVGGWKDAGLGEKTIQSVGTSTNFGAFTVDVLTVTGGGLTASALVGARARGTSGAFLSLGTAVTIADNDTTTITLVSQVTPGAGNTFVVEVPSVVVQINGNKPLVFVGGMFGFDGIKFQSGTGAGELQFLGIDVVGTGEWNGTNGGAAARLRVLQGTTFLATGGWASSAPGGGGGGDIGNNYLSGMYVHDVPQSTGGLWIEGSGTTVSWNWIVKTGTVLAKNRADFRPFFLYVKNSSTLPMLKIDGAAGQTPASADIVGAFRGTSTAVSVQVLAGCSFSTAGISCDTCGADGVQVDGPGATAYLTKVVGTLTAGIGVVVNRGGFARVTDANTGTTISGPSSAQVKVGANATTTWANVAGGLAANVTDAAAASPQGCWCIP